ncbi:MAG TPA: acyl carrier protein [Candidatus Angelobacter sp.]|nr:acyl carrier protein [Candidatus Angelobacter sp.]
MELETIKTKIKEAIHEVTGLDAATISDSASYIDDLGLDSLAILEIAVAVENQFKFHASDDELSSIRTVEDTIALVKRRIFAEVA